MEIGFFISVGEDFNILKKLVLACRFKNLGLKTWPEITDNFRVKLSLKILNP
jgi:hypothetical protein